MSKEQWALLTAVIMGFLSATVFGWAKQYFSVKGQNFATRQDIELLHQQLKENIDITKSIERTYSREDFLWRSELAYREQQLSQLYGPAYGYVMSQRKIYALWMDHKMHEVNFDVKKLLSTQNHILRDLIISKSHLIDGPQMPDSFVRFFTSTLVFDLYAAPSDAGSVPEQLKADARYPDDFDDHIIKTTERLRARIEMLHAKFAAPLDN
jgi:hypothetical protein